MAEDFGALCEVPRETRDEAWRDKFIAAVGTASFVSDDPPVLGGPDGFPYRALSLTATAGGQAKPFAEHVDAAFAQGTGIVINARKGYPDFVFPFGQLWSWKNEGVFWKAPPPPPDPAHAKKEGEERQVMVAQPSESYFPSHARQIVAGVLRDRLGISLPAFFLLTDFSVSREPLLVFNIYPDKYKSWEELDQAMRTLQWYLPPHYGMVVIDRKSPLCAHLAPL